MPEVGRARLPCSMRLFEGRWPRLLGGRINQVARHRRRIAEIEHPERKHCPEGDRLAALRAGHQGHSHPQPAISRHPDRKDSVQLAWTVRSSGRWSAAGTEGATLPGNPTRGRLVPASVRAGSLLAGRSRAPILVGHGSGERIRRYGRIHAAGLPTGPRLPGCRPIESTCQPSHADRNHRQASGPPPGTRQHGQARGGADLFGPRRRLAS